MNDYASFLESKRLVFRTSGVIVDDVDIHPQLFPFQRDLTRWAARKGRAAIFADTGLGKTFMQVEWARLVSEKRALIIAPLSVARQTVKEATKIGVEVVYSRGEKTAPITITNYEMFEHFNADDFDAVVLDESSILKSLDGKTRRKLTSFFLSTPYKLCCTATPAPNDIAEIANHAEFLGIMTRSEMLASFFVHIDNKVSAPSGWRLKGHAEEPFYRWLASWGMSIRKPSDLGYSDEGFVLPPLTIKPVWVKSDFSQRLVRGIGGRQKARRASLSNRVDQVASMVGEAPGQWIVWCGLNDEGRRLASLLSDESVLVEGSDPLAKKIKSLESFQSGESRVLITKPKIAGFGMNFQNCHQLAFLGLSDSWEHYYQCIRRSWRYGQSSPVDASIILSEVEKPVYDNVMRKEGEATRMREELIKHAAQYEREEIEGRVNEEWEYVTAATEGKAWRMLLGDSCERMVEVESESVDLSIFSPPFLSLYTYSPTERDIGNSHGEAEFYNHFGIVIDELLRITKPGRNCAVHVQQVTSSKSVDGIIGLKDFRGGVIRSFQERGWIYHGEVCIDKDPQAQAIRTKSKALLFVQMHKDSSWSRPALADYILLFRKPGDNQTPITPDLTNEEWIEWARPIWYGIRESDTLNIIEGRDSSDERHIAPLQLGTVERVVRLWSNRDELVFSPFAGIGSEGYIAVKEGRRFLGIELKESYFLTACRNLARVEGDLKGWTRAAEAISNSNRMSKKERELRRRGYVGLNG